MAQFDIIRNHGKSGADVPYLLILQNNVMSELHTSIVAPLRDNYFIRKRNHPNPSGFEIGGVRYRVLLSELAAIPSHDTAEVVMNLSGIRRDIISALDLIFTGFERQL